MCVMFRDAGILTYDGMEIGEFLKLAKNKLSNDIRVYRIKGPYAHPLTAFSPDNRMDCKFRYADGHWVGKYVCVPNWELYLVVDGIQPAT